MATFIAWTLLLVVVCSSAPLFCQSTNSSTDDRGTLAWQARGAQRRSTKSLDLPAPISLYAEAETLETALDHTSLVLAELVGTAVSHDQYNIVTWRKYRLLEKLSFQSLVPAEAFPQDIPNALLPLSPDNFVVPMVGGSITLDGIHITMGNTTPAMLSGRHLMFLLFRASGYLALANYGPNGLFTVDDANDLHPWAESLHDFQDSELYRRTSGKLDTLRSLCAKISGTQKR